VIFHIAKNQMGLIKNNDVNKAVAKFGKNAVFIIGICILSSIPKSKKSINGNKR